MKLCSCKDWKKNCGIIESAITMSAIRGFNKGGLKKIFNYCPWCGKKLVEEKLK